MSGRLRSPAIQRTLFLNFELMSSSAWQILSIWSGSLLGGLYIATIIAILFLSIVILATAQSRSFGVGMGSCGIVDLIASSTPPYPPALSLRVMEYPGGNISALRIWLLSQVSVPVMISGSVEFIQVTKFRYIVFNTLEVEVNYFEG